MVAAAVRAAREAEPARAGVRQVLAVLAAAFALRAVMLAHFLDSPLAGVYRADLLYYRTWALGILDGSWPGGGVYEQGPLYAYLLVGLYSLVGTRDTLVVGLQLSAGALTAALAHGCALRLFGARAALCAGLLAAGYGPFLLHESLLMKSFLEPLLVLAALWAGLRYGERRSIRWVALGGVLIACAVLVREVHALLFAAFAAWIWATGGREAGSWRARAPAVAAFVFAAAAVLLPVSLRNLATGGEFAAVTAAGGENFYLSFGPEAAGYYRPPPFVSSLPHLEHEDFRREARRRTGASLSRAESSRYWFRETVSAIAAHPLRAARLVAVKAVILGKDYEMPDNEDFQVAKRYLPLLRLLPSFGSIVGLGLLGLAILGTEPEARRGRGLLLGFLVALVLGLLLTFMIGRYRLAFAALWILLAGRGAAWLWERARRGEVRRLIVPALVLASAGAFAFARPPMLDPGRVLLKQQLYADELEEAARMRDRLPALQAAAAAAPRDPGRQQELGAAFSRTGRVPEAIRAFSQALDADPGQAPAHVGLAWLFTVLGRTDRAAAEIARVLELDPGNVEALRLRSLLGGEGQ